MKAKDIKVEIMMTDKGQQSVYNKVSVDNFIAHQQQKIKKLKDRLGCPRCRKPQKVLVCRDCEQALFPNRCRKN